MAAAHASRIPHVRGSWTMDQAVQQTFSPWQLTVLRDALDGYRMFKPDERTGTPPLSWNTLTNKITAATGVEFGKDDIRQFVEGKKRGHGAFRTPNPKRLNAIYQFAIDPLYNLLSVNDFKRLEDFDRNAPFHLCHFLRTIDTPDLIELPQSLAGRYANTRNSDNGHVVYTSLSLHSGAHGAMIVHQVEFHFDYENLDQYPIKFQSDGKASFKRKADPIKHFHGWAVLTPEDNILFFMKEADVFRNHYFKLIVEEPIWSCDQLVDFRLARFSWPYEVDTEDMDEAGIKEEYFRKYSQDIATYSRVGDRDD